MEYKVVVGWDEENKVYYVVESDIEGLWLEKPTFEELLAAIQDVSGNLIKHNHTGAASQSLRIYRDIGAPVPLTV